jgi:hypothetical protein
LELRDGDLTHEVANQVEMTGFRCLVIPLSSAAGYFDDQEHRGDRHAARCSASGTGIHLQTS